MKADVKHRAMQMLLSKTREERAPKPSAMDKPSMHGVTITITPGIVSPTDDHDTVEPDDDADD